MQVVIATTAVFCPSQAPPRTPPRLPTPTWCRASRCLERLGLSFRHVSAAHHRKKGPRNGLQAYPLQWGQVLKPLCCGTRTCWRSVTDFSGIAPGNNCSVRNRGILSSSRTIWVKTFSDQKGKSGCRHALVLSGSRGWRR